MDRLQKIKEIIEARNLCKDVDGEIDYPSYDQQLYELNDSGHIDWLIDSLEQNRLQESLLLERLKKQTLQIKEMKQNSRLIKFYEMAEENLKLAQEVARLKDDKDLFAKLFIKVQLGD